MRPIFDKDRTMIATDYGSIPYDPGNDRVVDYTSRTAKAMLQAALAENNMTVPDPYLEPAPSPAQNRSDQFISDVDRVDLLSKISTATPAQIKTYVTNTVTDLPSARVLLMKILLLLATNDAPRKPHEPARINVGDKKPAPRKK